MIDLHCHLDLYPNPIEIINQCMSKHVKVLSVTTTPSAWNGTSSLTEGMENIYTALGFHPQLAAERYSELSLFDELINKTKYIGEVGLDRSPECIGIWKKQVKVFDHILSSCQQKGGRILSIHSRRAASQVLELLKEYPNAGTPILHWFSGSIKELKLAIKMDCYFSVGPPMFWSKKGLKLIEKIPRNRIITESDGPFTRKGDQSLTPWDVQYALNGLANLWKVTMDDVTQTIESTWNKLNALSIH